jgi:hypothetical protein
VRKTRTALAAAFITAVFLLSCEAPLDFEEFEDKSVSLEVETVAPGSFHRPGDSVPVSLVLLEGDAAPWRIDFILTTEDGSAVASRSIELGGTGTSSLPDLQLPEVEPGLYILESSVYDVEESLLYRESSSFFIVEGEYAVRRISILPVTVEPESDVLLLAVTDAPEGSNPYLVWRMGNDIIHEGTVTSRTVKAHWRSPEVEGVYSLEVELFPFRPKNLVDFHSQAALETDVYVSRSTTALKGDLGPAENYVNLFHLRGNYNDDGYGEGEISVEETGNPLFDVRNNLFGLNLGGSSGVVFSGIESPPFGKEPFSLVFRMLVWGGESRLLRYASGSGESVFTLSLAEDGELRGMYEAEGLAVNVPSGIFPADSGGPITVILSAYPAGEGIDWYWYLNGRMTGMSRTTDAPDGEASFLEVGGERGFPGILDEIGIHTRNAQGVPAALENPFEAAARGRYGNALRYAEGFGSGQPSDVTALGGVVFERGRALLAPKGSLLLPPVDAGGERISLGLYLPEAEGSLLVHYSFSEADPVSRELTLGDGEVKIDEEGFVWLEISAGSEEAAELSISLENGAAPLVLGAIILLSERTELTDKTESEEDSVIS